jgi:hypothetical protein
MRPWGTTNHKKQGPRGRGVKDSSERQGSKTLEPWFIVVKLFFYENLYLVLSR